MASAGLVERNGMKSVVVDSQKLADTIGPLPTDGRTAVKVEVALGA